MEEFEPPQECPFSSQMHGSVHAIHQFRLLIVDDNEDILFITKQLLECFRIFKIDTAISVKLGLEKLHQCTYDVILSDYEMPEINGIVFLEIIRHMGDTTPFVIYSHKTEDEIKNAHTISEQIPFLDKGTQPGCICTTLLECIGRSSLCG
jgi:DNA-binding NtrC family response regulator